MIVSLQDEIEYLVLDEYSDEGGAVEALEPPELVSFSECKYDQYGAVYKHGNSQSATRDRGGIRMERYTREANSAADVPVHSERFGRGRDELRGAPEGTFGRRDEKHYCEALY